jgi:hypothetical protein
MVGSIRGHLLIRSEVCDLNEINYSRIPLIRTLVIRIDDYPDWIGPSGKFVKNPTKLTFLEITGYRIRYSTVLWLL